MSRYVLALISIVLGATGQLFFKKGSIALTTLNIASVVRIFSNKYLVLGICCYSLSTLVWIHVLSKMKLSVAYPMVSFGYVVTFAFAALFLKEHIYLYQLAGLLLIMVGILIIAQP